MQDCASLLALPVPCRSELTSLPRRRARQPRRPRADQAAAREASSLALALARLRGRPAPRAARLRAAARLRLPQSGGERRRARRARPGPASPSADGRRTSSLAERTARPHAARGARLRAPHRYVASPEERRRPRLDGGPRAAAALLERLRPRPGPVHLAALRRPSRGPGRRRVCERRDSGPRLGSLTSLGASSSSSTVSPAARC